MRRHLVAAVLLAALSGVFAAPAAAGAATAPLRAPAQLDGVRLSFDRDQVQTVLGNRFTVRSQITNLGAAATDPLLAHLNVASLTGDVYVDPEDWSESRSRYLQPLEPGGTIWLTWEIQAVNSGRFDLYVVLLPNGPSSAGRGPLAVSPPVYLDVAGRQTLSAGGALPVVLVVPAVLGLATLVLRRPLRRRYE